MFINENTANIYYNEATAEPSYMYEAILEANEAYHDLCMKMVKCEHTAIVNENTSMLAEAEGDFKAKAMDIGKKLLDKFFAFLDRVKTEWSKLWSGVISKLVNPAKVDEMKKLISGESIEVSIDLNAIKRANDMYKHSKTARVGYMEKFATEMNKFSGDAVEKATTINVSMIEIATTFLRTRPDMIKDLEGYRKTGKEAYVKGMNDVGAKPDNLEIAKFSSAINKVIVGINKATLTAVRICKAALGAAKKSDGYKDASKKFNKDQQAARKAERDAKRNKEGVEAGTASYSILDQF